MKLCLAGHFCIKNTLKSPNGFPIHVSDRSVGWEGSLEMMQSDLFLALSLKVAQSSLKARFLPLLIMSYKLGFFSSGS